MSQPSVGVAAAIAAAARATGVSATYLTAAAQRESAFDPQAEASTSSAAGLFQFIESTWLETLSRHGAALGLDSSAQLPREQALALRFDPQLSALMAGALTADNAEALQAKLGRAPSDGELYAAHVLGAGGAARLIEAAEQNGDQSAAALFPAAAKANRGLFFAQNGAPVSAAALMHRFTGSLDGAIDPSSKSPPSSEPAAPVAPSVSAPAALRAASSGAATRLTPQVIEILAALKSPERGDRVDDG